MPETIKALQLADRAEWLELWDGYLTFYETELDGATTDATFARLVAGDGMHGAIARDTDGTAIGLVHWLTHPSTWATTSYCYLEDLFVAPGGRSRGTGEALIEHVVGWAKGNGSAKVYWLTAETNSVARRLYDRVATHSGFTHYEVEL